MQILFDSRKAVLAKNTVSLTQCEASRCFELLNPICPHQVRIHVAFAVGSAFACKQGLFKSCPPPPFFQSNHASVLLSKFFQDMYERQIKGKSECKIQHIRTDEGCSKTGSPFKATAQQLSDLSTFKACCEDKTKVKVNVTVQHLRTVEVNGRKWS